MVREAIMCMPLMGYETAFGGLSEAKCPVYVTYADSNWLNSEIM